MGTRAGEVHVCAKFKRHAVLVDFAQFEFNARVSLALCPKIVIATIWLEVRYNRNPFHKLACLCLVKLPKVDTL